MTDTSNRPRLLNLVEVGERLNMKKSNVAKFLARRGIEPSYTKAQGNLWREDVIEAVKAEREADAERMAADEKRRTAALRNVNGSATVEAEESSTIRLGPTEREVLELLLERPQLTTNRHRNAARRLRLRGLVERVAGEQQTYRLTGRGLEEAGKL